MVRGSVGTAAGVGIACYLTNYPLSRGFYVLAFAIGLPALMVVRAVLRRALHRARRRGVLTQRVLIAGTPGHVDEVADVLLRESWLGYDIVGALTPTHDLSLATDLGIPVLGSAEDVVSVAAETGPTCCWSPAAPSPPRPRCAASRGTSSSTPSRWSWHRA